MVNLSTVTTVLGDASLVDDARALAERLLASEPERWHHTQGVAARAAAAAVVLPPQHRPALLAASWVHDIGYAGWLHYCEFHPLNGAWHLQALGYDPLVVGLVAHHSGARFLATELGLSTLLAPFDDPLFTTGALADALTYSDQTTGPQGQVVDVDTRLDEVLTRHGPGSPHARSHRRRAPAVRSAVGRTEQRLARHVLVGPVGADL